MAVMNDVSGGPIPPPLPPLVLLVEDNRDTLEMYSTFFTWAGVRIAGVESAAASTAALELHPVVIVTDVPSPSPDTAAMVKALKADPATAGIPLVVLTDGATQDLAADARRAADLVLGKPVFADALLDRIREVLVNAHHLRRLRSAISRTGQQLIDKSDRLARTSEQLRAQSERLFGQRAEIDAALRAGRRKCPSCDQRLEWVVPNSRVQEAPYDFYHWCRQGCGLYYYDRSAGPHDAWVKLA